MKVACNSRNNAPHALIYMYMHLYLQLLILPFFILAFCLPNRFYIQQFGRLALSRFHCKTTALCDVCAVGIEIIKIYGRLFGTYSARGGAGPLKLFQQVLKLKRENSKSVRRWS